MTPIIFLENFHILRYTYPCKGDDHINIKIKPQSKIQKFFHTTQNKLEDILFFIIQKTPEAFIPQFFMNWIDNYLTKRTQQLQQELIHQRWQQVYLEKAVGELNIKQDKK